LERVFAHLNSLFPLSFPLIVFLLNLACANQSVRVFKNNSIRYPQLAIISSHPTLLKPSRLALVLATPAHIFPLTPEQLHRIPLSHPLSVDPCSPAFHSRSSFNDLSFFLVALIPCLTYIHICSDISSSPTSRVAWCFGSLQKP
jgi:hypothetical protein